MKDERIRLFTRQAKPVLDALDRDGVCRVKKEYVAAKYGESAWSFGIAYDFFIREMARRVPLDPGAESPFWLHGTAEGTGLFADTPLLILDVPKSACVFFDSRDWNRILNLDYLPKDPADGARFERLLGEQGLPHAVAAFQTPHFPLVKQQIVRSWSRLFDGPMPDPVYLQAAVWQLEQDWIVEIRR